MKNLSNIVSKFLIEGTVREITPLGAGLINDTYKVTTFVQKIITGGYLRIQYNIKNWEQIKLITNIKFLDAKGFILSNNAVYIPVASDTMIEHRINIREVTSNG